MKEEIEKSSGNLYADLGHKEAEEMHAKATLAMTIYKIVKQRRLSQTKVSKMLGIPQSAISRLLQGKLSGFSTDRLLRILNQLGQDVDIKVKPIRQSKRRRSIGRTAVFAPCFPLAAKGR